MDIGKIDNEKETVEETNMAEEEMREEVENAEEDEKTLSQKVVAYLGGEALLTDLEPLIREIYRLWSRSDHQAKTELTSGCCVLKGDSLSSFKYMT